jgi:hypothetical protein
MTLIEERNKWRDEFESGEYERPWAIHEYQKNREDCLWRSTRIIEHLCEYTLYLESLIKD